MATQLQHLEPQFLERINGHFGYRAVARLRFLHGPLPKPALSPRQRKSSALSVERLRRLSDTLDGIKDPELRQALEQLGRYYSRGILVQKDQERAVPYLREAASLGNLKARLQFAELLLNDFGSPLDYEDAYRWLYQSITADKSIYRRIVSLRLALEARMPSNVISRAKRRKAYW